MKNKYRTIYCGEVTKENIGEEIKVAGWVEQIRNLGSLVFLTLRDETGLIQLISEEIDKFSTLTRESTITATGIVRHRADGMTNPNMKTGEVEVLISSYELLGAANNVLPFEINYLSLQPPLHILPLPLSLLPTTITILTQYQHNKYTRLCICYVHVLYLG